MFSFLKYFKIVFKIILFFREFYEIKSFTTSVFWYSYDRHLHHIWLNHNNCTSQGLINRTNGKASLINSGLISCDLRVD